MDKQSLEVITEPDAREAKLRTEAGNFVSMITGHTGEPIGVAADKEFKLVGDSPSMFMPGTIALLHWRDECDFFEADLGSLGKLVVIYGYYGHDEDEIDEFEETTGETFPPDSVGVEVNGQDIEQLADEAYEKALEVFVNTTEILGSLILQKYSTVS